MTAPRGPLSASSLNPKPQALNPKLTRHDGSEGTVILVLVELLGRDGVEAGNSRKRGVEHKGGRPGHPNLCFGFRDKGIGADIRASEPVFRSWGFRADTVRVLGPRGFKIGDPGIRTRVEGLGFLGHCAGFQGLGRFIQNSGCRI
jgi:hypothetical protein